MLFIHMQKEQTSTLNFKDDGIYMVLSLPSSIFDEADANDDDLLSIQEFAENRASIIEIIQQGVTLGTNKEMLFLQGVFLTPITPHESPKNPATRIVVLGKFNLPNIENDSDNQLRFSVNLFNVEVSDDSLKETAIKITASKKNENLKQVFELNSDERTALLDFI